MRSTRIAEISRRTNLRALALAVIGCALSIPAIGAPAAAQSKTAFSSLASCRADLAKRLSVPQKDISLANAEPMIWSDAALGMPEIGKTYAQVQTPGERVYLKAKNRLFFYTASAKAIKYGGPLTTWANSILYLKPVQNEPNLNGDLYQCSLIGTNGIKVASGVSDYYPQDKGYIIIKSRTSRSSHDLLYVRADKPGELKPLCSAFDIKHAAFNSSKTRWAAITRSGFAVRWVVVTGETGKKDTKQIELPADLTPEKVAWSLDSVLLLCKKNENKVAFKKDLNSETSKWEPISNLEFPGEYDYILNKSETLEINSIKTNDQPGVEVVRVWFTGDRKVLRTINNLELGGYELISPYAIIWGTQQGKTAVYSVDISDGLSVSCSLDGAYNVKPLQFAPSNSPVPAADKIYQSK